jgi:hypothetical protein
LRARHVALALLTNGNGPITGAEVQFNVTFVSPFGLPSDHYFFVPQVEVTGGTFLWLSAASRVRRDAQAAAHAAGVAGRGNVVQRGVGNRRLIRATPIG